MNDNITRGKADTAPGPHPSTNTPSKPPAQDGNDSNDDTDGTSALAAHKESGTCRTGLGRQGRAGRRRAGQAGKGRAGFVRQKTHLKSQQVCLDAVSSILLQLLHQLGGLSQGVLGGSQLFPFWI